MRHFYLNRTSTHWWYQRLGHANIQTTLNVYSHVMPGLQEAAALKFDEIVCKQLVKTDL